MSRIWLMTSDKLVDHRVDLGGQIAQLVAPLDVGAVVEMPSWSCCVTSMISSRGRMNQRPKSQPRTSVSDERDRQDDDDPDLVVVDRGEGDLARDGRPGRRTRAAHRGLADVRGWNGRIADQLGLGVRFADSDGCDDLRRPSSVDGLLGHARVSRDRVGMSGGLGSRSPSCSPPDQDPCRRD